MKVPVCTHVPTQEQRGQEEEGLEARLVVACPLAAEDAQPAAEALLVALAGFVENDCSDVEVGNDVLKYVQSRRVKRNCDLQTQKATCSIELKNPDIQYLGSEVCRAP